MAFHYHSQSKLCPVSDEPVWLERIQSHLFLLKLSQLVLLCPTNVPTKFSSDIYNIFENRKKSKFDTWRGVGRGKLKCEVLYFKMA